MARNRKSQSAELRFGPALKALLICLFIGGAGIGYVYQKTLLNQLGDDFKDRGDELDRLRFQNEKLEGQLFELESPKMLERRVAELGLNLRLRSPSQIVVVVDGAPRSVAPVRKPGRLDGESQLARGETPERHPATRGTP